MDTHRACSGTPSSATQPTKHTDDRWSKHTSVRVPLTQTRGAKDILAKIILFAPPAAILKLDPENKLTT